MAQLTSSHLNDALDKLAHSKPPHYKYVYILYAYTRVIIGNSYYMQGKDFNILTRVIVYSLKQ
jgi:ABC-type microcin C transport system permease subunit YejB